MTETPQTNTETNQPIEQPQSVETTISPELEQLENEQAKIIQEIQDTMQEVEALEKLSQEEQVQNQYDGLNSSVKVLTQPKEWGKLMKSMSKKDIKRLVGGVVQGVGIGGAIAFGAPAILGTLGNAGIGMGTYAATHIGVGTYGSVGLATQVGSAGWIASGASLASATMAKLGRKLAGNKATNVKELFGKKKKKKEQKLPNPAKEERVQDQNKDITSENQGEQAEVDLEKVYKEIELLVGLNFDSWVYQYEIEDADRFDFLNNINDSIQKVGEDEGNYNTLYDSDKKTLHKNAVLTIVLKAAKKTKTKEKVVNYKEGEDVNLDVIDVENIEWEEIEESDIDNPDQTNKKSTKNSNREEAMKEKLTFEQIKDKFNYDKVFPFKEGIAMVKNGSEMFHIQENGEPLYKEKYKLIRDFKNGVGQVSLDRSKLFLIDQNGEKITEEWFHDVKPFDEEGIAIAKKQGKKFHIDKQGRRLYEQEFSDVSAFYDGVASVWIHDRMIYINMNGEEVDEDGNLLSKEKKRELLGEEKIKELYINLADGLQNVFEEKTNNIFAQDKTLARQVLEEAINEIYQDDFEAVDYTFDSYGNFVYERVDFKKISEIATKKYQDITEARETSEDYKKTNEKQAKEGESSTEQGNKLTEKIINNKYENKEELIADLTSLVENRFGKYKTNIDYNLFQRKDIQQELQGIMKGESKTLNINFVIGTVIQESLKSFSAADRQTLVDSLISNQQVDKGVSSLINHNTFQRLLNSEDWSLVSSGILTYGLGGLVTNRFAYPQAN